MCVEKNYGCIEHNKTLLPSSKNVNMSISCNKFWYNSQTDKQMSHPSVIWKFDVKGWAKGLWFEERILPHQLEILKASVNWLNGYPYLANKIFSKRIWHKIQYSIDCSTQKEQFRDAMLLLVIR